MEPLRVLIADDSSDDAALALRELRQAGYAVQDRVVDSAQALSAALDAGQWDVVLSDYVMPAFGGLEALRLVRQRDPDLPVIMLSGKVAEETAVEAMKAGATDFVMKDKLSRLAPVVKRELADAAARRGMRQAQLEWRSVFDSVRDAVVVYDAEFRILRANRPYAALAGMPIQDVIGKPYWEVFPRREGPLPGAVRARDAARWAEDECRLPQGATLLSRVYPVLDTAGRYLHSVNVLLDVTERDRVREALAASERKFHALIENSSDIFLVVDPSGKLVYRSESGKAVTGYESGEVMGGNVLDLVMPEDRARAREGLARAVKTPGFGGRLEVSARRKDGSPVDLEIVLKNCVELPEIGGVIVTARDITERKRAQARIGKLNRLYAMLSGVNNAIVHSTSLLELGRRVCELAIERGRFCMAWLGVHNPADQSISPMVQGGLSDADVAAIRESMDHVVMPDAAVGVTLREGRVAVANDFDTAAPTTAWDAEARRRGALACAVIPVHRHRELVAVLTLYAAEKDFFDADEMSLLAEMSEDMSFALANFEREENRRRFEKELRESELRFRSLADISPDGIFQTDRDGNATYLNRSWGEVAGMAPSKGLGLGWTRAIHPEDRQRALAAWYEAMKSVSAYQGECRFLHADGSVRWAMARAAPEKRPDGTLAGYVGTVTDITARKLAERELVLKNAILSAQQDTALDGIYIVDDNHKVISYNRRFAEIWGIPPEVLKTGCDDAFVEHVLANFERPQEFLLAVENLYERRGERIEDELRLKDGRTIERFSAPMTSPAGDYYGRIFYFRDVTERKNAEARIQELAKFPEENPNAVLRVTGEGKVTYANASSRALVEAWRCAPGGRLPEEYAAVVRRALQAGSLEEHEVRVGAQSMALKFAPIPAQGYVNIYGIDITARRAAEEALRASDERFRRYFDLGLVGMAITLPDRGMAEVNDELCRMLGYTRAELLRIDWAAITHPEDVDADLAQFRRLLAGEIDRYSLDKRFVRKDGEVVYATISAACVRKPDREVDYVLALLQDVTHRRRAEETLHAALVSTVEAMAATVETRDPYTAGHQRRVADLAAAIAREMGLSAELAEGIHFGALIHDLGKVQVPAELLAKPTRLSNLEFELIKTHPQAGYDIVKSIRFPWRVAEMVHQHHERLDGTGYPRGLKGEEIALEARILAVADVVEAMASHRPYRPALGMDAALREVEAKKGKWFDPDAVEACVRLIRERGFSFDEKARAKPEGLASISVRA